MENMFSKKLNLWTRRFAGICFLFLFLLAGFGVIHTILNTAPAQTVSLSDVWIDEDGNSFSLNTFEKTAKTDTHGKKIYYTLSSVSKDNAIILRCRNMFLRIYINDTLVYEDDMELNPIYGSSPGNRWHTIALDSSDEPQTICIEGFACYENSNGLIDNIYLGHPDDIYTQVVKKHFGTFFTALFMLLAGIVLLIMCAVFHSKKKMQMDLFYLGIGVFYAAIWCITESLLCQLFFAHSEVIHLITYTTLITLPLPFSLLAVHRFNGWKKQLSEVYTIITCINITVVTFLHITGIREYHYTLISTHILLGLLILLLISLLLSYIDYKETSQKIKLILVIVLAFIALCLIVGLSEFMLGWFGSFSGYTQIAMLGFLCCLIFYHLHQMVNVLQKGMEADMLHNLALTDYLTGLYNRTAFAEHHEIYMNKMIENSALGVIQFDVNNLKWVNDTLGHEKGDYLIQLVSEGLQASFSDYGNCYRMGGDEFLVILTGIHPEKDYEAGIQQLSAYCDAHNVQPNIDFKLEIAHGFVLDYNLSLSEAIEKADNLMYQNKKELKKQNEKADH